MQDSAATLFRRPAQRRWGAFLGPTNSGKTWRALSVLKSAGRGHYLAPLRLLALEVCESLRQDGVRASLITGEERDIDPKADILCSTIEMYDSRKETDVIVIDEIQMLADPERGWAWTQAVLGANARHLVACGSLSAASVLREITGMLDEPLEIEQTRRYTPLEPLPAPVPITQIEPGTILVVFSRRSVIDLATYLAQHTGCPIAQIYGAMPPETRRHEAARFRNGEAPILVATDAIAMGLNLPAHTVLLGETEKFDGVRMSRPAGTLLRQIAGRAGRFGMHAAGAVGGIDYATHQLIAAALHREDRNLQLPLRFQPHPALVHEVADASDARLTETMNLIRDRVASSRLVRFALGPGFAAKARMLDTKRYRTAIPISQRMVLAGVPLDLDRDEYEIARAVGAVAREEILQAPEAPENRYGGDAFATNDTDAQSAERIYRHISAYLWLHFRFPVLFPYRAEAEARRARCARYLIRSLRHGWRRRCGGCGNPLPLRHAFPLCNACYHGHTRHY